MKYTKENFEKVYDKITEIHSLANNDLFTLNAINAMLLLLKNNMYIAMETDNELELKPYWYLNGFGKRLQERLRKLRKK